jgi:MFS family permease
MATLITFGVGFFARPFGAALLGAYADKAGRKTALTLTVLLMACGSFMIAVCPTDATIGIAAPIILCFARLLQGFSAGGEIGGAIALLAEDAPVGRRAFYIAIYRWNVVAPANQEQLTTVILHGKQISIMHALRGVWKGHNSLELAECSGEGAKSAVA